MPAITRSQMKMFINNCVNKPSVNKPSVNKPSVNKPSVNKPSVNHQVSGKYKYASTSELPKEIYVKIKNLFKYTKKMIDITENNHYAKNHNKYGPTYFDNIRIFTELYCYICESIHSVLVIDGLVTFPNIQKLINMIYLKSISLLKEVNTKCAKTYEQQHIINCFIQQMQETQDKIYLYVTEKPKRFPRVCYTEWDEDDEPEDCDSDSDYEDEDDDCDSDSDYEDEDEDEDYEDEDEDYEDEDEDYEDEDEDYEDEDEDYEDEDGDDCDSDSDYEEADGEEYRIQRVANNHIRFIYNR
jgi:hypothetical protein